MLESALDIGIAEKDFWEMTVAEVSRAIESDNRRYKIELKARATMDYALAGMIGAFVSNALSPNEAKIPSIEQIYPSLFEEEVEKKQNDINVARFMQYAAFHNLKYKQEVKKSDDR